MMHFTTIRKRQIENGKFKGWEADGMSIPNDLGNGAYRKVQEDIAEGATVLEYEYMIGDTLAEAKAKKIAILKHQAKQQYEENVDPLYSEYARKKLRGQTPTAPDSVVTAYEDSIKSAGTVFKDTVNAFTTKKEIREYEPVWPTPPS